MIFDSKFEKGYQSAKWLTSPSMIDGDFSSDWEVAPTSGKEIWIMRTILRCSFGVDLSSNTAKFRILKDGYDGVDPNPFAAERTYASLWDYMNGCDHYSEYPNLGIRVFEWEYDVPIVLKSSENAKIRLHFPDGLLTAGEGDKSYLSIKFISVNE